MPLPHPWPGKDGLWELQGGQPVSPAARAPGGMRQGPAPGYPARFRPQGRCAAWPRIKHDVLGSACCTAKQPMLMMAAWCLASVSHPTSRPRLWPVAGGLRKQSLSQAGQRTAAEPEPSPRAALHPIAHMEPGTPCGGPGQAMAAQTAGKEGRQVSNGWKPWPHSTRVLPSTAPSILGHTHDGRANMIQRSVMA